MSRRALSGLLVALALSSPAWAEGWKETAKGDGYVSQSGTITASATPQSPSKVLAVAKAFAGLPYVWAGTSPTAGFDCSGYAYEVLRLNGYEVPRMADQQFEATKRVAYEELQPGDMVFFQTYLPGPSHVGFFLGGGEFIHASSAAEGVVVSTLKSGYYRERFLGGGRPANWQVEPMQVADVVQPVASLSEPAVTKAVERVKTVEPEFELTTSPFARRRAARKPQPLRVAVVPEVESSNEAALEEWKLTLGETLSIGRLQLQKILKAVALSLG